MNKWITVLAVAVLGLVLTRQAQADTIVFDKSGFISGSQSFAFEFTAPSAGTMTVKLTNFGWPERLSSLSFAASTATSILQRLDEAGTMSFNVSSPGAYFAHVAGVAQGSMQLGLYSLQISFQPLTAPVPLPANAWLLLSGLAALAGLLRGKTRLSPGALPRAVPA